PFTYDAGSTSATFFPYTTLFRSLVTGTPVFNNPEGFEGGLGDWSTERGTWQVGVPTSGPRAAYTGTNCAATVLAGNYPDYVDSRVRSSTRPDSRPPESPHPLFCQ